MGRSATEKKKKLVYETKHIEKRLILYKPCGLQRSVRHIVPEQDNKRVQHVFFYALGHVYNPRTRG